MFFKGQKAWLVSELLQTENAACLSWWMNLYGRNKIFEKLEIIENFKITFFKAGILVIYRFIKGKLFKIT